MVTARHVYSQAVIETTDQKIHNKTIVDSRLRLRYATLDEYSIAFVVELNLVGILAVIFVVFSDRLGIHVTRRGRYVTE